MKSMTGFGKATYFHEPYQIDFEVKSVNHRFLDTQIRLPREYNVMEMPLRQLIKCEISRGRIETSIYVTKSSGASKELRINWLLLDSLIKQLTEAEESRYLDLSFDTQSIVNGLVNHDDFFEIVENQEEDPDLESYFLAGMTAALIKLNQSRETEGQDIASLLTNYLTDFKAELALVVSSAELYEADYQQKLTAKVTDLLGESVDESRLLTEVTLLIERGDIHEELDRLDIHIKKLQGLLLVKTPIGREMDFLIQEMNREVNTIGSKSAPITIKESVVQMKTILEKIREQVQNVE
ncbi:YicC/YloC family endoribonuclease [Vagococcus salmoninarum]|uniref:YicC/YloC family endoribonuclease n=1 Tax=Vagococcus salmoninarum TaxID=2739 RepID=UPI0018804212|nr:YicC/YloC family endoribonuclease [Vagococcus salmoninarum]MBE9387695.1 YicC family protein [Vagococcus salmoninarum]